MQVRVERVTEAERAQRYVGVVLVVVALLCALVIATVAIFLVTIYVEADHYHPELSGSLCCALFGIALPLTGLAAAGWGGARNLGRARGLETILRTLRSDGSLDEAALAERLGPRRAERARIDALAAGALVPDGAASGASVRPAATVPLAAPPAHPAGGAAFAPTALGTPTPFIPPTGQGGSHRPPPYAPDPRSPPFVGAAADPRSPPFVGAAGGYGPAMAGAAGGPASPAMAGAWGGPPAMAGASGGPPAMAGASGGPASPAMAGASGGPASPAMAGASGGYASPAAAAAAYHSPAAIRAGLSAHGPHAAASGPLSPALAATTPMVAGLGSAPAHLLVPSAPPPAASRPPSPGSAAPADLVGRTLKGTWFVEARLAAGGMGAVHVARHLRTGRRYALKTMLPDERLSLEAIHRFEREAKAASAIGHAGIVGVHDFDRTEDGVSFIVMDLLEGETLEDRLARVGRLSWPEAKKIGLEIADALAAAHRGGILHRDLKPSNVFLARREGASERAVLVDFGLAKPIREGAGTWVTRTGAIVGTAHYMSPEQARGERVDVRSDVYGLGAVVYETIAGVPPFLGSTAFAVMTMLLTEQPVAPSQLVPGVPAALDALLLSALAKNAADRPADVAAFAAALAIIP